MGIIITVIVLTIATTGKKDSLTEEEIITRARQLGMVMEEEQDAEKEAEKDAEKEAEKDAETQQVEEQDLEPDSTKEDAAQSNEPTKGEEKATQEESGQGTAAEPVIVTVEISQGEYSDQISYKLLEAGLVSDAEDFNKYLTENGVDDDIAIGQHQITLGATYEEIASILCEKQ